ncbi:TAXI family TRAP transporter solute-binding subunit [Glutamicibacter uratoxydans]|uniref:TAXI family TRAP transporter solute-binding subunit n=1 Tax=Glutamicibacter uratoxydans TaxID=43667 RepID=UPI003D6EC33B
MTSQPRELSRRSVLRLSSLGLLGGALTGALAGCQRPPAAALVRVAGGEQGGLYHEFAVLLAQALVRYRVADAAEPLVTQASTENIELLLRGEAQLGLALADSVAVSPAIAEGQISALGRVYQNYFHLLVRAEDPIYQVADLRGKPLGAGAKGAGTWLTGQRLLDTAGLKEPGQGAIEYQLGLNAGLRALTSRRIDAMMISGGIAIHAIAQANVQTPLRLLDLSSLIPALRAKYPGLYDRVVVPQDTYHGMPSIHTLGVSNLLIGRTDLPDQLVSDTVRVLVQHAGELIPNTSAGIQFLSLDNLVATAGQPLHPAAAQTYRELHG